MVNDVMASAAERPAARRHGGVTAILAALAAVAFTMVGRIDFFDTVSHNVAGWHTPALPGGGAYDVGASSAEQMASFALSILTVAAAFSSVLGKEWSKRPAAAVCAVFTLVCTVLLALSAKLYFDVVPHLRVDVWSYAPIYLAYALAGAARTATLLRDD